MGCFGDVFDLEGSSEDISLFVFFLTDTKASNARKFLPYQASFSKTCSLFFKVYHL